ncbi:hypothetical protein AMECASPLE_032750 [Ameca splendens]|uniref:Uncharacterized protein n=1 Tax=Ameca splendens TaxID=208324 RepID=A0ABV1A224_9TELE
MKVLILGEGLVSWLAHSQFIWVSKCLYCKELILVFQQFPIHCRLEAWWFLNHLTFNLRPSEEDSLDIIGCFRRTVIQRRTVMLKDIHPSIFYTHFFHTVWWGSWCSSPAVHGREVGYSLSQGNTETHRTNNHAQIHSYLRAI